MNIHNNPAPNDVEQALFRNIRISLRPFEARFYHISEYIFDGPLPVGPDRAGTPIILDGTIAYPQREDPDESLASASADYHLFENVDTTLAPRAETYTIRPDYTQYEDSPWPIGFDAELHPPPDDAALRITSESVGTASVRFAVLGGRLNSCSGSGTSTRLTWIFEDAELTQEWRVAESPSLSRGSGAALLWAISGTADGLDFSQSSWSSLAGRKQLTETGISDISGGLVESESEDVCAVWINAELELETYDCNFVRTGRHRFVSLETVG